MRGYSPEHRPLLANLNPRVPGHFLGQDPACDGRRRRKRGAAKLDTPASKLSPKPWDPHFWIFRFAWGIRKSAVCLWSLGPAGQPVSPNFGPRFQPEPRPKRATATSGNAAPRSAVPAQHFPAEISKSGFSRFPELFSRQIVNALQIRKPGALRSDRSPKTSALACQPDSPNFRPRFRPTPPCAQSTARQRGAAQRRAVAKVLPKSRNPNFRISGLSFGEIVDLAVGPKSAAF